MRIFHRIDDVRTCSRDMVRVLEYFAGNVRGFIVAAIPCGFTAEMATCIREFGNCHVYQHGYRHINRVESGWCDEFPDSFPEVKTRKYISDGKHRLEDLLQREVAGYVPPWNNTGLNTVHVLEEIGFKIYSAQKNNTREFQENRDVDVDVVASYKPRIVYRPLATVMDEVKNAGRDRKEIGVLYHFKHTSGDCLTSILRFVKELELLQSKEGGCPQ